MDMVSACIREKRKASDNREQLLIMKSNILEKIDKANMKKNSLQPFSVGDNIKVSIRIREGGKERTQVFSGTVIAKKGSGSTETFTVRRISFGKGVERIFPVHSPNIVKIEVEKSFRVRRAKLYYLRQRLGKTSRLKQKKASAR